MGLSKLQKELICLFKAYEMTEAEVIWCILFLKKVSHQRAMFTWIENNTTATSDEVIQAAFSIRDSSLRL